MDNFSDDLDSYIALGGSNDFEFSNVVDYPQEVLTGATEEALLSYDRIAFDPEKGDPRFRIIPTKLPLDSESDKSSASVQSMTTSATTNSTDATEKSNDSYLDTQKRPPPNDCVEPEKSQKSTTCPASQVNWPNFHQRVSESRYQYLCRAPFLLAEAVNGHDYEKLKLVFEEFFVEDCTFRSDAQIKNVTGRDLLLALWIGVLTVVPDYVVVMNIVPSEHDKLLTVQQLCSGTSIAHEINQSREVEALYNIIKYGRVKDKAVAYTEARTKLLKKSREKQRASFRAKTIIHLILNTELTHFTHLRSVVVELECVEDQALTNAPDA